jgi:hypothetical protein
MYTQDTYCAGRTEATQLIVRPEITPAVLTRLEHDRDYYATLDVETFDEYTPSERDAWSAAIEKLIGTIRAAKPIDLAARMVPSPEADTWTGPAAKWYQSFGVYLLRCEELEAEIAAVMKTSMLAPEQRDGLACVDCGGLSGPVVPIPDTSPEIFAHDICPAA